MTSQDIRALADRLERLAKPAVTERIAWRDAVDAATLLREYADRLPGPAPPPAGEPLHVPNHPMPDPKDWLPASHRKEP